MIRNVHMVAVTALTFIFYTFAFGIGWCAFVDTKPPFELISGKVVSYDRQSGMMMVEWEGLKNRYCPGTRSGWLRDAGQEPPPHAVVPLPEVKLPPEGFRGVPIPRGSIVRWRTVVDVPPYLEDTFVYKAEWDFACNPIQAAFPLRVQSQFIEIKPQT